MTARVVSVSGGKDSTALYLLAAEAAQRTGRAPIVVFADTGHEHPATLDYVRALPERTGGPPIRWVRADFSERIARKRQYVRDHWPAAGVPAARVSAALELLRPTGIPFLDLCMLKGRFPSTRARFCSEELKALPIAHEVVEPLLAAGTAVASWQGVRADESAWRAALPPVERRSPRYAIVRPILRWSAADVFALHRRHGVAPNPLYLAGCARVGCMPCIHARKSELRVIAERWPDEVTRVAEWERLVGAVSKRGTSSFFAHDKIPGEHHGRTDIPMPGIEAVAVWARTGPGGDVRQGTLFEALDAGAAAGGCSSVYGLCE